MRCKFRQFALPVLALVFAGFVANAHALPAESNGISGCVQDREFSWADGSGNTTQLQTCHLYQSVPGTTGPIPSEISSPAISFFGGVDSGWAPSLLRVWEGTPGASILSDFVLLTKSDLANYADTATLYSEAAQNFQALYDLYLDAAFAGGWSILDQTEAPSGVTSFEVAWFPDSTNGEFGYDLIVVHSEVPEPAMLTLLGLGLAGVAARRRRSLA